MREIKFRAWDKVDKQMFTVKSLHIDNLVVRSNSLTFYRFDDIELMQYTGIKDENGVDVYEGDHITIFKDGYYGGFYAEEKYSGVVDLDDTGTAFILKNATYRRWNEDIPNKIGDMEISFSMPDSEDLEQIYLCAFDLEPSNIVINGNIYENPELLEEK